jgi:signal transduction histidine kinase
MHENYRDIKEGITSYVYTGTFIFMLLAILFLLFIYITINRRNRLLHEKQAMQMQFQQELYRAQIEIQEQTLQTISQEIHDNIGQTLSLAKMNLNLIQLKMEDVPAKLEDLRIVLSKAIQDLRGLSHALNKDSVLKEGLYNSIQAQLQFLEQSEAFKTCFNISGLPAELDPQKELILFRIVQEALNNILKHAQARKITIDIKNQDGMLSLTVEDDGGGFDVDAVGTGKSVGSGLLNMRHRAKLLGATFTIQSKPGTRILMTVPI